MISILLHFQNDRKMRKKLQMLESDLAKFSVFLGFAPFFYACPPIDEETLYARAPRVSARGRHKWTRGATESSHAKFSMMWLLVVLNRGTERRGSDEERTNETRASTDEVGGSRRRAYATGEREAAEA